MGARGIEKLMLLGISLAMMAGFVWFIHWLMHLEILPPSILA
jgi:hypothetical protein